MSKYLLVVEIKVVDHDDWIAWCDEYLVLVVVLFLDDDTLDDTCEDSCTIDDLHLMDDTREDSCTTDDLHLTELLAWTEVSEAKKKNWLFSVHQKQ